MKFEPGKYYRHTGGDVMATLDFVETTMWGKTLVAERAGVRSHNLVPVGVDSEKYAVNWREISKKEWMGNFS